MKSQGSPGPRGPGDVKKLNIDCLGEKILADYSIGPGDPGVASNGGFMCVYFWENQILGWRNHQSHWDLEYLESGRKEHDGKLRTENYDYG